LPATESARSSGYPSRRDIRGPRAPFGAARPVNAADMAQARLFDDILERENAELHQRAAKIAASCDGGNPCPDELRRIHARITEVRRLLDALRDRFPPA
jgi:hypothetical protein